MKGYGWNNTGIQRYYFIVAALTTHFAVSTLKMMPTFSLILSTTNTPTYTSQ